MGNQHKKAHEPVLGCKSLWLYLALIISSLPLTHFFLKINHEQTPTRKKAHKLSSICRQAKKVTKTKTDEIVTKVTVQGSRYQRPKTMNRIEKFFVKQQDLISFGKYGSIHIQKYLLGKRGWQNEKAKRNWSKI